MKTKKWILSGLIMGLFAICGMAQTATPRATQRQINQQARIVEGNRTGQLTPQETRALEAQQAHINREKRRAKADGIVTPQERRRLNRAQNRASRNIAIEKHDGQE
jgi:Na+-translocating ferredoxin:NAD+ oxidoreductase RnfG subunit